jgi:hypothetical protein
MLLAERQLKRKAASRRSDDASLLNRTPDNGVIGSSLLYYAKADERMNEYASSGD